MKKKMSDNLGTPSNKRNKINNNININFSNNNNISSNNDDLDNEEIDADGT